MNVSAPVVLVNRLDFSTKIAELSSYSRFIYQHQGHPQNNSEILENSENNMQEASKQLIVDTNTKKLKGYSYVSAIHKNIVITTHS